MIKMTLYITQFGHLFHVERSVERFINILIILATLLSIYSRTMSTISNPAKKLLRTEIKKVLASMTKEDQAIQSASITRQVCTIKASPSVYFYN